MSLSERVLEINERESNLFAIKFNYCLIIIAVINIIAGLLYPHLDTETTKVAVLIHSVVIILLLVMNYFIKDRDGIGLWIKYTECIVVLLCATIGSFAFNVLNWGIFYLPIILAARYSKWKFTTHLGLFSSFIAMAIAFIQVPMGMHNNAFFNLNYVHEGQFTLDTLNMNQVYAECLYHNIIFLFIGVAITIACAAMNKYNENVIRVEIDSAEKTARIKEEARQRTILEEKNEKITQLNKELTIAKAAAEAANQSKTHFLNNMSHELRTPMNAVIGFTKLMEKELENPAVATDYLQKIQTSGKYLLNIINDILEISQIEAGNEIVDNELYDIYAPENSVMVLFEDSIREKNLTICPSCQVQHRYVALDKTKIQEISINLLSNAIKYTHEGGKIEYSLTEIPCEKEGYATFVTKVSDNGIGMSKEFADGLFDYFNRNQDTSNKAVMGLGMNIVKKLVDMLGGTIEIESELGKGTTFTVTLTHKIIKNPDAYVNEKVAQYYETSTFEGKRILITEDNELNAEIAQAILEDAGFVIEIAVDGVECVKKVSEAEEDYYDAILMDIRMPNLNGYDATRRVRAMSNKKKANIPIIAMTANAFEEDKQKAIDSGMDAHLSKPINVQKLIEILSSHLQ